MTDVWTELDKTTWVALALGVTVLVQVAIARLLQLRRKLRKHWRLFKGRRAEVRAERLLRRHGYRILSRQVELVWPIQVDDEEHLVELRADLLVRRGRRRMIAEVKSGNVAPRINNIPTRRQLLEYSVAYAVDGVLLVDMKEGIIHEVSFGLNDASRSLAGAVCAALLVGAALGAGATAWWLVG